MSFDHRTVSSPSNAVAARTYVNRAERLNVLFPLLLTLEDGEAVQGTCENLSESGLLATFATPVGIWMLGSVDLSFGAGLLGIAVRVARVDGLKAGLAFKNMDATQRSKIVEVMAAARTTGHLQEHL